MTCHSKVSIRELNRTQISFQSENEQFFDESRLRRDTRAYNEAYLSSVEELSPGKTPLIGKSAIFGWKRTRMMFHAQ